MGLLALAVVVALLLLVGLAVWRAFRMAPANGLTRLPLALNFDALFGPTTRVLALAAQSRGLLQMRVPLSRTQGRDIFVCTAEAAAIVSCEERFCKGARETGEVVKSVTGMHSIIPAETDSWHWRVAHKLALEVLGPRGVASSLAAFHDAALAMGNTWDDAPGWTQWDLHEQFLRLTMETVSVPCVGVRFGLLSGTPSAPPLLTHFYDAMRPVAAAILTQGRWQDSFLHRALGGGAARRRFEAAAREEIARRRAHLTEERPPNFLDAALRHQRDAPAAERFSDEQVVGNLFTLMFAGHETTTATLTTVIVQLLRAPVDMKRAVDEAFAVLGADWTACPTMEQLQQLRFLSACVRESLRLEPPVPIVLRRARAMTDVLGHAVHPHDTLHLGVRMLARDTAYWGADAALWNPMRWIDAANANKTMDAGFKAFGSGDRQCVGSHFSITEQLVVLGNLLRRFELCAGPDFAPRQCALPVPSAYFVGARVCVKRSLAAMEQLARVMATAQSSMASDENGSDDDNEDEDDEDEKEREAVHSKRAALANASMSTVMTSYLSIFRALETRKPVPQTAPIRAPHADAVTVLWCGEQGSVAEVAMLVTRLFDKIGFRARMLEMSECTSLDALTGVMRASRLTVLCACTYNGEAPLNGRPFLKMLLRAQEQHQQQQQQQQQAKTSPSSPSSASALASSFDVTGCNFSIIGLGCSSWASTYQKVPRQLGRALDACGATAATTPVEFDTLYSRSRHHQIQTWFAQLEELFAANGSAKRRKSIQSSATLIKALLRPHYVVEWTRTGSALRPTIAMNAVWLPVAALRKCLPPACGRSVVHVALTIPADARAACAFNAGDHVMVYGRNSSHLVTRVLKRFGLSHEASLILRPNNEANRPAPVQDLPLETAISVVDLLAAHIELSCPAKTLQLRALTEHCDNLTRAKIERLMDASVAAEVAPPPTLLEVLERFPHVTLSFPQFLHISARMKPRVYSICNASADDGVVELLVSVKKNGLCSNFLESHIRIGEPVLCQVQSNALFHLATASAPLVLVGAGTGLAPLRALLRAASAQPERSLAGCVLYFGCRTPDEFLFADELAALQRERGLRVVPVYSRHGPEPQYVGDYMCSHVDEFRAQLAQQRGVVYICGASKIVERVVEAVKMAVGPDDSDDMVNNRVKMDVWQDD